MGIAFGVFGLAVYFLLLWRMTAMGYRLAMVRRDPLGLMVLGVIMATLLQWTNGNLYSVCWLLWFVVGAGDGLLSRREAEVAVAAPAEESEPTFAWRKPGEPRRVVRL
jgi:hypothetical protein